MTQRQVAQAMGGSVGSRTASRPASASWTATSPRSVVILQIVATIGDEQIKVG
jgi:hypothetical protein